MDKLRLAWALIGVFHLIAIALFSVIVARAMGLDFVLNWRWILGAAVFTSGMVLFIVWSAFRAE